MPKPAFKVYAVMQDSAIVDFLAIEPHPEYQQDVDLFRDLELQGKIVDAILDANPKVIDNMKSVTLKSGMINPDKKCSEVELDITLLSEPAVDSIDPHHAARGAHDLLDKGEPAFTVSGMARNEMRTDAPRQRISWSVVTGLKGKPGRVQVDVPALNRAEARQLARDFVATNRPDIDMDEVFTLLSLPAKNARIDVMNQPYASYRGYPNRTTYEVAQKILQNPLEWMSTATTNSDGEPRLPLEAIGDRINEQFFRPGVSFPASIQKNGPVDVGAVVGVLEEAWFNRVPTPRELKDNRQTQKLMASHWFEPTPMQDAILKVIRPTAHALNKARVPNYLHDRPPVLAAWANRISQTLARHHPMNKEWVRTTEGHSPDLLEDPEALYQAVNQSVASPVPAPVATATMDMA